MCPVCLPQSNLSDSSRSSHVSSCRLPFPFLLSLEFGYLTRCDFEKLQVIVLNFYKHFELGNDYGNDGRLRRLQNDTYFSFLSVVFFPTFLSTVTVHHPQPISTTLIFLLEQFCLRTEWFLGFNVRASNAGNNNEFLSLTKKKKKRKKLNLTK